MTSLATHTVAMVAAASGVDKAIKSGEHACNTWARFCAKRLMGDKPSLTLDDVSATLVAACLASDTVTKKQKAEIGSVGSLAKNGFATAYGWYRMLVRIHAANMLPQLAEAKSNLWALGKAVPSTQAPSKRKTKKGSTKATVAETQTSEPAKSAPASMSVAWKDVRQFIVNARKAGKVDSFFANEAEISVCIAELGNIARRMETARKAKAKAKATGTVAKKAVAVRKAA